MQSQILRVMEALTSIEGLAVYHYWRPRLSAPYCVFAEDGEGSSLHADNHKREQVITGTVDYFTKDEFDSNADAIQNALDEAEGVAWALNSVQYENDTNLIHYEWTFEVI